MNPPSFVRFDTCGLLQYIIITLCLHLAFCSNFPNYGSGSTESSGPKLADILVPNCTVPACAGPLGPIYCYGKILALSWHYFGSDYSNCTGSKLRFTPDVVQKNFEKLPKLPTKKQFEKFCRENFENVSYLDSVKPVDWVPSPPSFRNISDPNYKEFALKLNERWRFLTRRVRKEVASRRDLYPAIYVPNNFIIPGGGFSIYFYWDSLWIAKGLLASSMNTTVRGILDNFSVLVDTFGYIPNGGLLKLSSRSQPPVFPQMLQDYVDTAANKTEVLETFLPKLDREFDWWWANRTVNITSDGSVFTLFQYRTAMNCPRPESYSKDIMDAQNSTNPAEYVWSSIASACESGWDFSSRWFAYDGPGAGTKSQIMTRDLIPVDLNSFMCKNLAILVDFHDTLGHKEMTESYRGKLADLKLAMESVLWNDTAGIWFDFDLQKQSHRTRFYPSSFFPLYGNCVISLGTKEEKIWNYLHTSGGFQLPGGIPASLDSSGQQWDFPNAWAPLVHILVEGFRKSQSPKFRELARNISSSWVLSNYKGFLNSGKGSMWEKYDSRYSDGRPGQGGEYPVQEGFGWTNGVVLDLLMKYGKEIQTETESQSALSTVTVFFIFASVLIVLSVCFWFTLRYCRYRKNLQSLRTGCCPEEGKGLLDDEDL